MAWWIWVGVSGAYWVANLAAAVRIVRAVVCLEAVAVREREVWPRVSQVVPACNEAGEIREAVGSRLAEGYPETEIILIDDRSTDGTGAIVDALAAGDGRVRAEHITELPAGWLGKVHAMHCGARAATGEWLLFSDADVHLRPGALKRAISFCEARGLDHLAVFPEIWRGTWMLDIVMAMFLRLFSIAVRPHAVENPRSRAAAGVGAFNLVRRAALERTPGFEAVRLDVVDDMALGQMLKDHGARSGVANGRGMVGLKWYASVRDMAGGVEKSGLASFAKFSVVRLVVVCVALLVLELGVFAGLVGGGSVAVRLVAGVGVMLAWTAQIIPSVWMRRPWWPGLCGPLAIVMAVGMMLRAAWLSVRRGGMMWRGTLYSMKELRAGARLRFP